MADITLFAHRGSNPYPDHSLEAYRWAVNWGADYIEPDLFLTKDGVLVSSHDDHGYAGLTYAEAKALEPGLMTFDEIIELAKALSIETGREIGVIPETKSANYATSEALIQTLVAHDFTDPALVVIQSFNAVNLQQLHDTIMDAYGVDIPLAYLGSGITNPEWIATFADIVAPQWGSFTAEDVAAAHAAGLQVTTWSILGAESDMRAIVEMGVDAVFADDTALARTSIETINGIKVIYGTQVRDALDGSAGADKIYAMQEDDIVRAGDGDDVVHGDGGNDYLYGGAGNDLILGGSGDDVLTGGAGADMLVGGVGNDVIVAAGDTVVLGAGDGIDLVVADPESTVWLKDAEASELVVLRMGDDLILRSGADALVLQGGASEAFRPGTTVLAGGVILTGDELAALAVEGQDDDVAALLPDLRASLERAPVFAEASDIALGTDILEGTELTGGPVTLAVAATEVGAVYRIGVTLSELPAGTDGVRVLWGGEVIHEGSAGTLGLFVTGGSGDGSNTLVIEGVSEVFETSLDAVEMVKVGDAILPDDDNAAPEVSDAALLVSRDIGLRGQIDAIDTDGDALRFTLFEEPTHGSVILGSDGSYSYAPEIGYTGADSFIVLIDDGRGGFADAVISLTVVPEIVLGTDLVVNGSFEDISQSSNLASWGYRNTDGQIAGWTDANGARIEQHWDAPNGTSAVDGGVFIDMDGYNTNTHLVQDIANVETGATYRLSFSLADADTAVSDDGIIVKFGGRVVYEGQGSNPWQTFEFRITGGAGDGSNRLEFIATGSSLNTYGAALDDVRFVKIAEVGETLSDNSAPEAVDDAIAGLPGAQIAGQLEATDADGDALLTFALDTGPEHGAVLLNTDGSFTYVPDQGYAGADSFTYSVSDGQGGSDVGAVSVEVYTPENVPVGMNLLRNGGFEDLTGADNPGSWGYRNTSPAGVIAGWVNADSRAEVHRDVVGGVGATEGTYWFDMEGAPNNASLSQTVEGVGEGLTYQLRFSIADTDTAQANDTIEVWWGGELVYSGVPKGTWQTMTIDVLGGAGDGSNTLTFKSVTPNPNGAGIALDDISLVRIDANPNLIVNGSFEDLTGATSGHWSTDWGYRNPNGLIAGWQDLNGGRVEQHFDTVNGISAQDGKVWLDLDGYQTNVRLAQTVEQAETGETYELSFWLADANSQLATDSMRVLWGGEVVYEGQPDAAWEQVTLTLVGGTGDGSNQLVFESTTQGPTGTGIALDDVQLRRADGTLVTGTSAADLLEGSSAHDVLDGGEGDDTLAGGESGDLYTYRLGDGSDRILEEAGASGTDVLRFEAIDRDMVTFYRHDSTLEIHLSDGGVVSVDQQLNGGGLEMIVFGDDSALSREEIASAIVNRAPVPGEVTFGSIYDDDTLTFGAADLLAGSEDADGDTLSISGVVASSGQLVQNPDGSWTFSPEDGVGADVAFSFSLSDGTVEVATSAALQVVARAPDQLLTGGNGRNLLQGDTGHDVLLGGNGMDVLEGGDGDDRLEGGNGKDRLVGGVGDDLLVGGNGYDTFVFSVGDGNDVIADFKAGLDVIELVDLGITYDALLERMSDTGAGVLLALDEFGADTILLSDVTRSELAERDFLFA